MYYGGDIPDENGIQQEDINYLIADAVNAIIETNLRENMKENGRYVDPLFIATYEDVAIEYNEARDKYYLTLPATPAVLPHGLGVYEICPMQGEDAAFIPVKPGHSALYKGSPAAFMEGNIVVQLEGQRAYLIANFDKYKNHMKTVLVRLVQSLNSIDEEEEVPIPPGNISQVIDYCLAKLKEMGKNDFKNDRQEEVK